MWKKITQTPQKIYLAVKQQTNEFMKDERGLSGVVVAILLILVAVLAIVLIWTFLGDWLDTLWRNITGTANRIS